MGRVKDLTGEKYGRLTVLSLDGLNKHKRSMWSCLCDCGNETVVDISNLKYGTTFSCGCLRKQNKTTHGMCDTPTYSTWASMIQRCANSKSHGYEHYGGKGIKVCDKWKTFSGFLSDMGVRPEGMSLDRVNGNCDYEVNNCRWATNIQQANNMSSNRFIEYNGKRLTVSQWTRELGGMPSMVASRLKNGWDEIRAVSTPVKWNCKNKLFKQEIEK